MIDPLVMASIGLEVVLRKKKGTWNRGVSVEAVVASGLFLSFVDG